ncbi:aspartic peptidase domain-containing protein [Phlyctochytrium arcticum]|nr:aspartic peptidase domain-containing protein [Phlyctochytrium arcticum]
MQAAGLAHTLITSMSIGNPPQPLNIAIDTGSSLFWVRSACKDCSGGNGPVYDPEKSISHSAGNETRQVIYGDGTTVQCSLEKDTLLLGGISLPDHILCEADKISTTTPTPDGLLGLSPPTSSSPTTDFFAHLSSAGIKPLMGFWYELNEGLDSEFAGEISVGRVDYSKFLGEMVWLGVGGGTGKWGSLFSGVIIGGGGNTTTITSIPTSSTTTAVVGGTNPPDPVNQTTQMLASAHLPPPLHTRRSPNTSTITTTHLPSPGLAIFDTGTTLTLLPLPLFTQLLTHISRHVPTRLSHLSGTPLPPSPYSSSPSPPLPHSLYQLPCALIPHLPTLTFLFTSTKNLTLSPHHHIFTENNHCYLIYAPSPSPTLTILGSLFLRHFYTVFDYTGNRVGVAAAVGQRAVPIPIESGATGIERRLLVWVVVLGLMSVGWSIS